MVSSWCSVLAVRKHTARGWQGGLVARSFSSVYKSSISSCYGRCLLQGFGANHDGDVRVKGKKGHIRQLRYRLMSVLLRMSSCFLCLVMSTHTTAVFPREPRAGIRFLQQRERRLLGDLQTPQERTEVS